MKQQSVKKIIIMTHKELLKGNITRFKLNIRTFYSLEEIGLSTQHISLEIGPAYNKLRADLEVMVETWNDFIRLAVISKDPQPAMVEERENLKREIDQ